MLEPDEPIATVRQLLALIVEQQIDDFKRRNQDARFLRVLTERDVEAGLETGRVRSGAQEPDGRLPDMEQSIAAAMTAFQDGLYFVFVNDAQVESLEQAVDDVRDVLFVRLTPLAGG